MEEVRVVFGGPDDLMAREREVARRKMRLGEGDSENERPN